jgi:N-acetylglucosaminyl-diphospho-decaprenol L-rhamnosyltransferase
MSTKTLAFDSIPSDQRVPAASGPASPSPGRRARGLAASSGSEAFSSHIPDVTAIVVTHNSSAYLERCLTALSRSIDDLIVVDNASTDRCNELVRRSFPAARLIELGRNAGFGAACNIGIREASGRYVLLVNPDAWPIGDAIFSLIDWAERNPRVGVGGPALVNEDGSRQRSIFGYPGNAFSLAAFAAVPPLVSGVYAVWRYLGNRIRRPPGAARGEAVPVGKREFLVGAALLIRADVLREVGGFDERFFLFSEEADLCFRVRETGWSVACCPDARFVHVGAASSPVSRDWRYAELLRSYLLFLAKRQGLDRGRRARRLLVGVLSVRAVLTPGEDRRHIKRTVARLRSPDLLSPMA